VSWPRLPRAVAADGTVTFPEPGDENYRDPYTLPWVEGAESTLPQETVDKYPDGPRDLREKQAVLKSKRVLDAPQA